MTFRQRERLEHISRDVGSAARVDTKWATEFRRRASAELIDKDAIEKCSTYLWGLATSDERGAGAKAWQVINLYNNQGLFETLKYAIDSMRIEGWSDRIHDLRNKGIIPKK